MRQYAEDPHQETAAEKAARERRERPYPLAGEDFVGWLSRIGGPFVKVDQLQQCPRCNAIISVENTSSHRCVEKDALPNITISGNADVYFPEHLLQNPDQLRESIRKGNPNIEMDQFGNFRFKKKLWEEEGIEKPLISYLDFIRSQIEKGYAVTVDENAAKAIKDWVTSLEQKEET